MGTLTKGLIQRQDCALYDGKTLTVTRTDSTGGSLSGLKLNDWVDVLMVYGNGADYTRGTILKATQSLGSTNMGLMFSPGTWTIDDNLTIGANFTCIVPPGCVFNIAAGKTLTINGVLFRMHGTYTSGAGTCTVNGTDLLASAGQTQTDIYAADSGVADAYVISTAASISSYVAGQTFRFKAANTNTGASTINVDGQGVKNIVRFGTTTALVAGDILNGGVYTIVYDGTSFQLQQQPVTSFIETLLDDANAATARSTLGVEAAGRVIVQRVEATPYLTYSSTSTTIPGDDTIPLKTEGSQYLTVTITPTNSANRLLIEASLPINASAAMVGTLALFQDATTNALAATTCSLTAANVIHNLTLAHEMQAGTTSSTTFAIRAGPSTGTLYINGSSSARLFGGVMGGRMRVTEIAT